jgi:hypothetical protein
MIGTLGEDLRAKAERLIPRDLGLPSQKIVAQFRALSAFLDKAMRHTLEKGPRASAEMNVATRRAMTEIVAPGLESIGSRFWVPSRRYLEAA